MSDKPTTEELAAALETIAAWMRSIRRLGDAAEIEQAAARLREQDTELEAMTARVQEARAQVAILKVSLAISANKQAERAMQAERRIEELTAERDEARRFGEDAARKHNDLLIRYDAVTCAFCGQEYPRGTPRHGDGELSAHIKTCAKHPMRAVERELAEARENADFLRDSIGECHLMISRKTPEFQTRLDWDATTLPARLRVILKRIKELEAEIARLRAKEPSNA